MIFSWKTVASRIRVMTNCETPRGYGLLRSISVDGAIRSGGCDPFGGGLLIVMAVVKYGIQQGCEWANPSHWYPIILLLKYGLSHR